MSIIAVLGSIIGVVGKVIGVAGSIFRVAKPILEAMRPAVDEVDAAMDWLEENAAAVGEESDDFLDRNSEAIADLEAVSARGAVVFGLINQLAASLRVASQETTPDRIDEREAAHLIELFGEIKDAIGPWRGELDKALESINEAEA